VRSKSSPLIPVLLFAISEIYYIVLSAKSFTWVFGSGDSGSWLASSLSWITPQPFGNPLYVLLGHFTALFPGDLVIKMTIIGSCLPAAATVSMVYLITHKLTRSVGLGVIASGILLASATFLTQSTVLNQYPLPILMTVLSFWFYLRDNRRLTTVFLGLGTAMHVMVGAIALLWIAAEWRQGRAKEWLRMIPLFLAMGILPYLFTLWELWYNNGSLSWQVISNFISNTSGAGELALTALPERLLMFVSIIVVSLGLALPAIWYGLKNKLVKGYWLMVIPIGLVSWYYLTALDPTVWHYLPWAMPFLAILAALGIIAVRKRLQIVPAMGMSIVILLIVNSFLLNADLEADRNPVALNLYQEYLALPNGSTVAVPSMGWIGFTLRYVQVGARPDLVRIEP
jgi:hypothetical protein